MPKRAIQKRPFMLFELLVAMSLLMVCLLPMVKTHVRMRQTSLKELVELQQFEAAQKAFCEFKAALHQQEVSLDGCELIDHSIKKGGESVHVYEAPFGGEMRSFYVKKT